MLYTDFALCILVPNPFQYLQVQLLCPRFNCPPLGAHLAGQALVVYLVITSIIQERDTREPSQFFTKTPAISFTFKAMILLLKNECLDTITSLYQVLSSMSVLGGGSALALTGVRLGLVNCSYTSASVLHAIVYLY